MASAAHCNEEEKRDGTEYKKASPRTESLGLEHCLQIQLVNEAGIEETRTNDKSLRWMNDARMQEMQYQLLYK